MIQIILFGFMAHQIGLFLFWPRSKLAQLMWFDLVDYWHLPHVMTIELALSTATVVAFHYYFYKKLAQNRAVMVIGEVVVNRKCSFLFNDSKRTEWVRRCVVMMFHIYNLFILAAGELGKGCCLVSVI